GTYHDNFSRRETDAIHLNVFEKFHPELPQSWRSTPFALLGNIHPSLQSHVLSQLNASAPFVAADTIDLWINMERSALIDLIRRINLFVMNVSEAELLSGESNIILAGR